MISGGPKLRKWYGAPELLPKDGPIVEDQEEEDCPGNLLWKLERYISMLVVLGEDEPLMNYKSF